MECRDAEGKMLLGGGKIRGQIGGAPSSVCDLEGLALRWGGGQIWRDWPVFCKTRKDR